VHPEVADKQGYGNEHQEDAGDDDGGLGVGVLAEFEVGDADAHGDEQECQARKSGDGVERVERGEDDAHDGEADDGDPRDVGVSAPKREGFGHHLLAVKALQQGLSKLRVNRSKLKEELEAHPEVHTEAIQTVMRKHGYQDAYEQMKKLTRGKEITREKLQKFVSDLEIPKDDKKRLLALL